MYFYKNIKLFKTCSGSNKTIFSATKSLFYLSLFNILPTKCIAQPIDFTIIINSRKSCKYNS